ncbi:MAG: FliM/FliN family flagellar motor switch protein [Acidimicrobiales bacterium]
MTDTLSPEQETPTSRSVFESRRLTPDRIAQFQRSADALAAAIEEEFSSWLAEVSVKAEPVQEVHLEDLTGGGDDREIIVIEAREQMSHGLVVVDRGLSLHAVVMLCGGSPTDDEPRPLTRLEAGVLDVLFHPALALAADAFRIGDCRIVGHVSDAFPLPDLPDESAIALPMRVHHGQTEGSLTLCFTSGQLQEYTEAIDRRLAGQANGRRRNEATERAVLPVPVDVVVGFDRVRMSTGQVADLEVGDVIRIGQQLGEELEARVGGENMFTVRPGQLGTRLVAEIVEVDSRAATARSRARKRMN